MHENPLVLTFDVGTQSARAMLVDKNGQVVSQKQKTYERAYHSPHPGWAEQNPDAYWDAICETSGLLKAENEVLWADIIAVTCTCIRATTICLDKDRRPLRDAIVWLDKRSDANLPPLPLTNRLAFKAAGVFNAVTTIRNNLACNWIINNQPEIWAKTDKFVLLSAYLNMRFCDNLADSKANTVGVIPYDTQTGHWMKGSDIRRPLYLMDDSKLIELVDPGTITGKITAEASAATGIAEGVPYVVTGADKACETFALSGVEKGCAALSFGTMVTVEVLSDKYFSPSAIVPPFYAISGGFLPEVETYRGYWLVSWFKEQFAAKEVIQADAEGCSAEELLNTHLKDVPPGCDGLLLQPTLTPDPSIPHAKGAIIGLSDVHTRAHLYRAIIEGINFSMMEGLYLIEKKGKLKINKLCVTGGGSRSREICQITANMFGLPVYRMHTHETCGVGSSIVGFVALGIYPDYAAATKAMMHVTDVFEPDMEEHKVYEKLFHGVYSKVFDNLAPLYSTINKIVGRLK